MALSRAFRASGAHGRSQSHRTRLLSSAAFRAVESKAPFSAAAPAVPPLPSGVIVAGAPAALFSQARRDGPSLLARHRTRSPLTAPTNHSRQHSETLDESAPCAVRPPQVAVRGGAARLLVEVQFPGGGTSRAALKALAQAVEAHAAAAGLPALGAPALRAVLRRAPAGETGICVLRLMLSCERLPSRRAGGFR